MNANRIRTDTTESGKPISVRGGARHDIRVKVSVNAKATPGEMITVGIRPDVHVVEGEMSADAFAQLRAWIELNRSILIAYWEAEIDTQDALEALTRLA